MGTDIVLAGYMNKQADLGEDLTELKNRIMEYAQDNPEIAGGVAGAAGGGLAGLLSGGGKGALYGAGIGGLGGAAAGYTLKDYISDYIKKTQEQGSGSTQEEGQEGSVEDLRINPPASYKDTENQLPPGEASEHNPLDDIKKRLTSLQE